MLSSSVPRGRQPHNGGIKGNAANKDARKRRKESRDPSRKTRRRSAV